jgi:hypothetical protein
MFLFCPMEFATDAIYSVKLKCAPTHVATHIDLTIFLTLSCLAHSADT